MKKRQSKFVFYLIGVIRYLTPKIFFRLRRGRILGQSVNRNDYEYILDRVRYYNKKETKQALSNPTTIADFKYKNNKGASEHFIECYRYIRYFESNNRFNYLFGDVTHIPSEPTLVKSRPIADDNQNSILLNLGRHRHFVFINDEMRFDDKENKIFFYGALDGKINRINLFYKYFGHPMFILGDIGHSQYTPKEWWANKISIQKQSKYKFILALEGNDVSTNMKWIMSSNSVAVCPKPRYETWFMEGTLIPDFHYIEIKSDYSDLIEKVNFYLAHPEKAKEIIKNANAYIDQFRDSEREKMVSLLVLEKYFNNTN